MQRILIGILSLGSSTLATQETCIGSTVEANLHSGEIAGALESNFQALVFDITDSHRLFYQAENFKICTTSDSHHVQGIQLSLGPYQRADWENYVAEYDPENYPAITLPMLGVHSAHCKNFIIGDDDYVKKVTMKHSPSALHQITLQTHLGFEHWVGSSQTDENNVFGWETTSVEIGEHARIQGAFGHTMELRGQEIIRTLGFLFSNCWDGMQVNGKGHMVNEIEASYFEEGGRLKPLSFNSKARASRIEGREERRGDRFGDRDGNKRVLALVFASLALLISCCGCTYCFLKNRKSIFGRRRRSDDIQLPDHSRSASDIDAAHPIPCAEESASKHANSTVKLNQSDSENRL